jgi:hypothetical protein
VLLPFAKYGNFLTTFTTSADKCGAKTQARRRKWQNDKKSTIRIKNLNKISYLFYSGKQNKKSYFKAFRHLLSGLRGCLFHFTLNLVSEHFVYLQQASLRSSLPYISRCRSGLFRFGLIWPESPLRALLGIGFTTYFKS